MITRNNFYFILLGGEPSSVEAYVIKIAMHNKISATRIFWQPVVRRKLETTAGQVAQTMANIRQLYR